MTLTITRDRIADLVEDLVEDGLSRLRAVRRVADWLSQYLTEDQLREVAAWGGKVIEAGVAALWRAVERAVKGISDALRRDPVRRARRIARRDARRAAR